MMLEDLSTGMTLAEIQAMGVGPSFYSLAVNSTGRANADITYVDGALFVQDDYRLRPNITLSLGLRYETQNNLGDHADFAPRLGFAWGIGAKGKNASPKIVLRGGYGIFYDRFTEDLILAQQLQNGVIQQQFLVQFPAFFNPNQTVLPSGFGGSSLAPQSVYQPNSNLRTPYTMQTGVSLERQLTKSANIAFTYLNSRGVHCLLHQFHQRQPRGRAAAGPNFVPIPIAGHFQAEPVHCEQ